MATLYNREDEVIYDGKDCVVKVAREDATENWYVVREKKGHNAYKVLESELSPQS